MKSWRLDECSRANLVKSTAGARSLAVVAVVLVLTACVAPANPGPLPYPPVPVPKAEVVPKPPVSENPLIWQPGHWEWSGHGYDWTDGSWEPRGDHSATWQDGSWGQENGRWVWRAGHWV